MKSYQASSSVGAAITSPYGILLAVGMFVVRKLSRSLYGVIEIVAGFLLLYASFHVAAGGFSKAFGSGFQTFRTTVAFTAVLGGVFAMVRGLDNISEALGKTKSR